MKSFIQCLTSIEPINVNLLSVPEPSFHGINFVYAAFSGVVGGLLILLLNKVLESVKNKKQYKQTMRRLLYELIFNQYILEISEQKINTGPIELRSSVWEEEKYNVIPNICNEMLREFDYTYMAIDLINGKTIAEIEDDFIVKIDINELKNVIEKVIDRFSIEVGINEKQLSEMIRRFQIKQ